jgi:hypothetical protein
VERGDRQKVPPPNARVKWAERQLDAGESAGVYAEERWGNPSSARGRSALAIATALTLRAVFRLALRRTERLIGSIIALLGLDLAVPDHSTLSCRAETLEVLRSRPGSAPAHLLVDSTGLKLCGSDEWLLEKHGTRTRCS